MDIKKRLFFFRYIENFRIIKRFDLLNNINLTDFILIKLLLFITSIVKVCLIITHQFKYTLDKHEFSFLT